MPLTKIIKLKKFSNRGYTLTPVELKEVSPFEVKRLYYMELPDDVVTGEHCHKVEEELFIQVRGSSTMIIDQGKGKEDILLQAGMVIYVPAYVWHGFKLATDNCLVLALSSTNYSADRKDYIENYGEYLKVRK